MTAQEARRITNKSTFNSEEATAIIDQTLEYIEKIAYTGENAVYLDLYAPDDPYSEHLLFYLKMMDYKIDRDKNQYTISW